MTPPFHLSVALPSVTLRPWQIEDLHDLVHVANNRNIAQYMTDGFPHPYTPANGLAFLHMATQNPGRLWAITISGKAAGGIGYHPMTDIWQKNAELGYWLGEPYWGNGILTEAVKKMTDYVFHQTQIERVFARPFGTNKASQRVLEKAGFKLEATIPNGFFKWGTYEDELIYAIRKTPELP